MSDRETAGLRGPVKMCVEESVHSKDTKSSTTSEYRSDGMLLTIRYDDAGPERVFTHVYDGAGRSLSITNNQNSDRTDFRYDEQGRMTEILSFDPKTIERKRNAATAGSAWDAILGGLGVPMGGTVVVLHDENGRPVEAQVRGANGDIVSRVVRSYNAEGRVSEERPKLENPSAWFLDRMTPEEQSQIDPAQVQALNKAMATMYRGQRESGKFYSYDAQGRATQLRENNFVFEKTTTILYNDHGDVAELTTTYAGNTAVPVGVSYSMDEEGNLIPKETPGATPQPLPLPSPEESRFSFSYEYDSYGNWTHLTTTQSPGSGTPAGERHRTLTYY
jgi:YD repeat-containing protein